MSGEKFLIIEGGIGTIPALVLSEIYDKHGKDLIIISPEEAMKKGIESSKMTPIKLPTPPIIEYREIFRPPLTRKQRRENDRKSNKKKKR